MRLQLALVVVGFSSVANAQPGADDPPPVEEPPPPPAPPPPPMVRPLVLAPPIVAPPPATTVDQGVIDDANSGRNWLTPTALTPPAGTWSFSDYELLLISGGYAVTDQFQISATTLLPVFEDMPFFGMVSAKYQFLKSGNVRAAFQGAIVHVNEGGDDEFDDDSVTIGNLGGALTLCIDDDCHSHFTGYLGAGFANEESESVPFVAAAAATLRLGKHVKAVFELDTAFVVGDINEESDAYLGWYGIRFTSNMIGVDLGFAKPLCSDCDDDDLPLGFPFVSFTYRAFKNQ
jgi:hypothetical protein